MTNHQTRERCDEHGVTLPCSGCRADELASTGERAAALVAQGVPRDRVRQILEAAAATDGRQAAGGEQQ